MRECASEETGEHMGESYSTLDLSLTYILTLSFVNYDSSILSSRRPFSPPEGCRWLRADALVFDEFAGTLISQLLRHLASCDDGGGSIDGIRSTGGLYGERLDVFPKAEDQELF